MSTWTKVELGLALWVGGVFSGVGALLMACKLYDWRERRRLSRGIERQLRDGRVLILPEQPRTTLRHPRIRAGRR